MKLEFLANGSPDCPLVRLYDFTLPEVQHLCDLLVGLSNGSITEVSLDQTAGIQSVGGCHVRLRVGKADRGGMVVKDPADIDWQLTREGWHTVAGLAKPFSEKPSNGYQWLDETGPVLLLLSPDGLW